MTVIENLPVTNSDIPESLFSRLPIRDSSVLSSLTSSSGKVADQRKGERNKSFLIERCSPTQQILTIKAILKDPI